MLARLGIKGLILDIDNTLARHNDPQPADGVVRVDMFDLQGRHQACICNQWYSQGEHKAEFGAVAKMWQPGIYFAKITIANSQPVIIKILRQ